MSIFQPITLGWNGVEYTIPSDNVLKLIAQVEDIITFAELFRYGQKGTAPTGKLSMAYGLMLRYAGARVTDEEVAAGMFGNPENIMKSVHVLLSMMLPPESIRTATGNQVEGK